MAQEFPSIIIATGLIDAQAGNNERGATTVLNGTVYTITLERGIALGWGVCLVTPRDAAVIAGPLLNRNLQVTDVTFEVEWAPSVLGAAVAQDFFYCIIATDEGQ